MSSVKTISNSIPAVKKALSGNSLLHAATNGGLIIQNYARQYVPVDTGQLKTSIHIEKDRVTDSGAYVNIGTPMIYANIQELGGTIKPKTAKLLRWKDKGGNWHSANAVTIKAQPYMRPAADNHRDEVLSAVGAALKQLIEGAL